MEPNDEKLLRSKILEAEKNHTEWNRDKVLGGLNFASTPKKRRVAIWYYAAAASLVLAFIIPYTTSNSTNAYQARITKSSPLADTSSQKIISPIEEEPLIAENQTINPIQHKKTSTIKRTPPTRELILPTQLASVQLASLEIDDEHEKVEVAVSEKKKIAPIIGIVYEETKPVEKQKKLPLQLEFGKHNSGETLANTENQAFLQTTLN